MFNDYVAQTLHQQRTEGLSERAHDAERHGRAATERRTWRRTRSVAPMPERTPAATAKRAHA